MTSSQRNSTRKTQGGSATPIILPSCLKTGCKPSEKSTENRLRFDKSYIIWLYCDPEILEQRVRTRIESMISQGGLSEIEEILRETHSDYTKGVLQSIGYKEFEPYISQSQSLETCVNNLVTKTLQYSKKQIRWIKNRMQPHLNISAINTNKAEDWDSIRSQGINALQFDVQVGNVVIPRVEARDCEKCGVKLLGNAEWDQHIRSRRHRE